MNALTTMMLSMAAMPGFEELPPAEQDRLFEQLVLRPRENRPSGGIP